MTEKEKLEKQIADTQNKLKELLNKEQNSLKYSAIKKLEEYTTEEKIKKFDNLYNSSLSELEKIESKKYHDDDWKHYAWEASMEILARDMDKFWEYYKSITD